MERDASMCKNRSSMCVAQGQVSKMVRLLLLLLDRFLRHHEPEAVLLKHIVQDVSRGRWRRRAVAAARLRHFYLDRRQRLLLRRRLLFCRRFLHCRRLYAARPIEEWITCLPRSHQRRSSDFGHNALGLNNISTCLGIRVEASYLIIANTCT